MVYQNYCWQQRKCLFLLLWETDRPAHFSQGMKETKFTCTYKCGTLAHCKGTTGNNWCLDFCHLSSSTILYSKMTLSIYPIYFKKDNYKYI